MFAVINRLEAIPGYSHGTVVSVHRNELEALIADAHLRCIRPRTVRKHRDAPLFVLPLAVCRRRGEHVRLSDLVDSAGEAQSCTRSSRLRREIGAGVSAG
jgi:hypothetical protein